MVDKSERARLDRIWLGIASDTGDVRDWSRSKPIDWPDELYLRATPELLALIDAATAWDTQYPRQSGSFSQVLNAAYHFARSQKEKP